MTLYTAAMSSWPQPLGARGLEDLAERGEAGHRDAQRRRLLEHQGLVLHEQVDREVLLEVAPGDGACP